MDQAGGPLVSIRDRRDHVIAVLTDQFSRDAIALDVLERRLELAEQAETLPALDALIADLVVAPTTALAPGPGPSATDLAAWPARRRLTAVFGSVEKTGAWTAARELTAIAVFGSTELDFRDAVLAPGVTELRIRCVFGSIELIVPPHVAVECDATAILGSVEERDRAPVAADPGRPVLRITGLTVFGSVEIETRLPGESRRAARQRVKRDAQALRGAPLPPARARLKSGD